MKGLVGFIRLRVSSTRPPVGAQPICLQRTVLLTRQGKEHKQRHSPFQGPIPKQRQPACGGRTPRAAQHSGIRETPGNNLTAFKAGQTGLGSPGKARKGPLGAGGVGRPLLSPTGLTEKLGPARPGRLSFQKTKSQRFIWNLLLFQPLSKTCASVRKPRKLLRRPAVARRSPVNSHHE